MAGPSDIASILSQSGRIEKINQNPFTHADVSKQIITEQEARERLRFAREVNESKRVQEASEQQHKEQKRQAKQGEQGKKDTELEAEKNGDEKEVKHLIDVVI
jgi:uncharacterized membrane protein YccC